MDKLTALTEIFDLEGILSKLGNSRCKIRPKALLLVLSKVEYNLAEDLGVSPTTVTRTLKAIWPDRPSTTLKVCSWLFAKYELKFCPNCNLVKPFSEFHKNSARGCIGLNTHCKPCTVDTRRDYQREYQATRRASKLERTPIWADLAGIKEFYVKCPEGMHVDHIVPLNGELVSGLHTLDNLQYLSALDNIKKSNKYDVK